jgi:hypothetical protein
MIIQLCIVKRQHPEKIIEETYLLTLTQNPDVTTIAEFADDLMPIALEQFDEEPVKFRGRNAQALRGTHESAKQEQAFIIDRTIGDKI